MPEFPAFTTPPAKVHARSRELTGHHPHWTRHLYRGGIYSLEHFFVCSWCGCIRPDDAISLLRAGHSHLEESARPGRYELVTPNPIAGNLVHMGTLPGSIFSRDRQPINLDEKLRNPAKRGLMFTPTPQERLTGHFDRPALESAPTHIRWPLYRVHVSDRQWPEIWAAASREGAPHG